MRGYIKEGRKDRDAVKSLRDLWDSQWKRGTAQPTEEKEKTLTGKMNPITFGSEKQRGQNSQCLKTRRI